MSAYHIAVINLSHECHSMLSPLDSSEFLNIEMGLGASNQVSLLLNLLRNSELYIKEASFIQ